LFSIYETRIKDYAAYAAANENVEENWKVSSHELGDTHPVVNVNWYNAKGFCEWLTIKERSEGKITDKQFYRLPTDAEWSVAVGLGKEKGNTPWERERTINKGVYPWGEDWPPPKGAANLDQVFKIDDFPGTSPVGSFIANRFGLYDLAGNAGEWCEDWYETPSKKHRTQRGSAYRWSQTGNRQRAANRGHREPEYVDIYIGFRCVLAGE